MENSGCNILGVICCAPHRREGHRWQAGRGDPPPRLAAERDHLGGLVNPEMMRAKALEFDEKVRVARMYSELGRQWRELQTKSKARSNGDSQQGKHFLGGRNGAGNSS